MKISKRPGSFGRLLRSAHSIMLLSAVVVVVVVATAGFMIWHNRQSALQEHLRGMNSMGVVLAEQTGRYAQVIDLILREVQTMAATVDATTPANFQHELGTPEVHLFLAERVKNIQQADAIVLIDASGQVANWSRSRPVEHLDTADRDYYNYFKQHDDPGLFVGSVSKSRAGGTLSLFFARRLNGPEGNFVGLVLGVVDIRHLSEFYKSAGEYVKEAVTLLRRDGSVLMRYPDPAGAAGAKLPAASVWYTRVAEGGGSYFSPGLQRDTRRLVTVHPLRDYPLVVDVVMEAADVFAQWQRDTVHIALAALAAALAFSGLFGVLAWQFRRQAEQNAELELGSHRFDALLSNIVQGVCFFDGEKRLLVWNRRYAEIYNLPSNLTNIGRSLQEIVAHRYATGCSPQMSQSDYLVWREQIAASAQPSTSVVTLNDGRCVAINHQPMPDGGWVATHEDITERQQAEASIAFMARHDALTKLPNRMLFQERMEQAITAAGRGASFALICLDLDKFKQVNDTLGHPVGDGLLIAVAERLQACVREGDTLARLGGDEFAIIQLGVGQPADAEVLASRILAAFRQPFEVGGHQIMSGTSIGITVAPGDSIFCETLMRDADIALYLAKTEGRGTARFFEPEMDARIHLRRVLELDLQRAIPRQEFELYYQPQVNLVTNRVSGCEALLRWHHPERGFVSPMEFIPVAEETGLIVAIGEWVLQVACLEARHWSADISVAVNLSPVQFRKCDIVATVQAALAASGLPAERLELEITESVFLHATEETMTALHQLRAMGVSIALDDFGTGYSSLSYLRSFQFNKIKIDQSFVRDLTTNKESMSIVRAVIGLGQSLGIRSIAEGVETQEQLNKLRQKGCTEVQGYLFSRPIPAGELPAVLDRLRCMDEAASCEPV